MLTANVSKIKKSARANITFILNALSENGIVFVCMSLFSKSKSNVILTKMYFFKWGCIRMRKYAYITSQVFYWTVQHIYIVYKAIEKL